MPSTLRSPPPAAPRSRLFFLDWLRIAAFALLVLYHVGMYYVSWGWHVKSPHASTWLEPLMRLSSPWRLSLLFVLSGAATSLMLRRDGASRTLLAARATRLGLPLLAGVALIVPPQSYFQVVQQHAFAGGYLDFLRLYFGFYGGFCGAGGGCLILPTWNHLWFVAYLLVYTLLLWAAVRLWPDLLERLGTVLQRVLRGPWLLAAPVAVLAALRVALIDRFAPTHALVDDWYQHAGYAGLFVVGAAFARQHDPIWARLVAARWPALAWALVGWIAVLAAGAWLDGRADAADWRWWPRIGFALTQWCGVVAALGFARQHWNRDHPWRRYLTDAVYPVYIVHQTLIIVLAVALARWSLPVGIEATLLVTLTFGLSALAFEVVRRVGWLRPWFGLDGAAHDAPAATATATALPR